MPPRVGQPLAPAPRDIADLIEVQTTNGPLDSTVPFDPAMESGYTGAKTEGGRATTVQHHATATIPVYNYLGEDRQVAVTDLEQVLDHSLAPDRRLYLRCPRCVSFPNGGLHPFSGPNSCPASPTQRYMTCRICASRGIDKRVYESAALPETISGTSDDVNFVTDDMPDASDYKARLRELLASHMTAFHPDESQKLFGLYRVESGRGWRNVWGRD